MNFNGLLEFATNLLLCLIRQIEQVDTVTVNDKPLVLPHLAGAEVVGALGIDDAVGAVRVLAARYPETAAKGAGIIRRAFEQDLASELSLGIDSVEVKGYVDTGISVVDAIVGWVKKDSGSSSTSTPTQTPTQTTIAVAETKDDKMIWIGGAALLGVFLIVALKK